METNTNKPVTYTCSMHPEVVSNEPGKCPKCRMKLVLKLANRTRGLERMLLWCLVPIAIILLLPFYGVRFDATWIIFIVLAGFCILPMLFMRHGKIKNIINGNN